MRASQFITLVKGPIDYTAKVVLSNRQKLAALSVGDLVAVAKRKWALIAEYHQVTREKEVRNTGANSCALCSRFLKDGIGKCLRCPVRKYTGREGCIQTPYAAYSSARNAEEKAEYAREFVNLLSLIEPATRYDTGEVKKRRTVTRNTQTKTCETDTH